MRSVVLDKNILFSSPGDHFIPLQTLSWYVMFSYILILWLFLAFFWRLCDTSWNVTRIHTNISFANIPLVISLQFATDPEDSRGLRIPQFLDCRYMKIISVVNPMHRPPLSRRSCNWYSMLLVTDRSLGSYFGRTDKNHPNDVTEIETAHGFRRYFSSYC